jgi:ribose 5-phosphate isomerase B
MKIVLSADHRGIAGVRQLYDKFKHEGKDVELLGDCSGSGAPSDYPERAWLVGQAVAKGQAEVGILICGTGIGMAIAANKVKGVRAAVVHDELTAQLSRSHNNANVLCLSADLLGQRLIEKIAEVWLATEFEGGRHARRIRKITAMENGQDPSTVKE